ncbi:hypothetical protein BDV96DRAFT_648173 [Lophiotrema nucula]|uniref:Uncharacterized protein n=1 Tax=Lophiotrema nucula TaxID=690887 RepID=A0A6A5Z4F6_9PLEO|nr:hypothetical protein BDV96DRAFT_648173 [Lophiotrema nucula]
MAAAAQPLPSLAELLAGLVTLARQNHEVDVLGMPRGVTGYFFSTPTDATAAERFVRSPVRDSDRDIIAYLIKYHKPEADDHYGTVKLTMAPWPGTYWTTTLQDLAWALKDHPFAIDVDANEFAHDSINNLTQDGFFQLQAQVLEVILRAPHLIAEPKAAVIMIKMLYRSADENAPYAQLRMALEALGKVSMFEDIYDAIEPALDWFYDRYSLHGGGSPGLALAEVGTWTKMRLAGEDWIE